MALTRTSYAILGQLALREWTTYELTKQLRRNLHYFWPRAESRIYDEAKRLVVEGLATAEEDFVGRRARTTYRITPGGRQVLRRWLESSQEKPLSLEFEGLLRVFLSPFASREALLATLERVRLDAEEMLDVAGGIGREYLEHRAPFQKHVHVRAFVFDFLLSHALTTRDWAERTRKQVEAWPELSKEERAERGLETIDAGLRRARRPRA